LLAMGVIRKRKKREIWIVNTRSKKAHRGFNGWRTDEIPRPRNLVSEYEKAEQRFNMPKVTPKKKEKRQSPPAQPKEKEKRQSLPAQPKVTPKVMPKEKEKRQSPPAQPKVTPKVMPKEKKKRQSPPVQPKVTPKKKMKRPAPPPSLSPAQPVKTVIKYLVPKAPKSPLKKVRKGRITKKKEVKGPKVPKFKVTVNHICRFFNMVDYPLLVTDQMKKTFKDFSSFKTFYSPLLASVNPVDDPLKIKTYCRAKWREGIISEAGADQSPFS